MSSLELRFSEPSLGRASVQDSSASPSQSPSAHPASCLWVSQTLGSGSPPPKATTRRVLHLINGQYYAGAERVQDLLAQYLPEFGFPVAFVALKHGLFVHQRRCQDVPVWPLPMRNRLDFRPAWPLARLIQRGGYRMLHAHTPRSLLVGSLAAWLAGVPLVYHVHSPAWADSTRWLFNRINTTLEQWLLRRADAVICVSAALANQMHRRGLPRGKMVVVPNGVPTPTVQWQPPERVLGVPTTRDCSVPEEEGKGLGLWPVLEQAPAPSEGGFASPAVGAAAFRGTIGTVALFRPRKGIEVLLEALALLNRQGIRLRLRAVGPFESPRYHTAIQQKVLQLGLNGQVQWTGLVKNVEAELLKMDIFILPSLFGEGLPMVLLEAMAVGMPIIASRIPGIDELIRPGQEGLLVPPGHPAALAQAIAQLLTHPDQAAQLGQQARQRHLASYSAPTMAAGVAQVYRQVLARHSHGRQ